MAKKPDTKKNKKVVRSIEAAWNESRLDDLDRFFARDFGPHSTVPGMAPSLASAKLAHGMALQSFPDRQVEILDMIAEGDKVFVRNRVTGTNTGGAFWFGAPEPSDKTVDFETWGVYRLRKGKVVDHWGINDGLKAMIQLGGYTPPAPPPDAADGAAPRGAPASGLTELG